MRMIRYATVFSIVRFVVGCIIYNLMGDINWYVTALKTAITAFFAICIGYILAKQE